MYQNSIPKPQTTSQYVNDFESIFNQLEIMESPVAESMQESLLFARFRENSGFPYGVVIAALQTMSYKDLTWDKATSRLLSGNSAQKAEERDSGPWGNDYSPIEQKGLKTKAKIQRYNCGTFGPFKRECKAERKVNVKDMNDRNLYKQTFFV